jgi:hypothetical protein
VYLYEQVLQKCHQQGWFGTDSQLWLHQRLGGYSFRKSGDLDIRFYYAPATEDEIRVTERALGFSLPQDFRLLYQQVANGGFGPDHGLIGVTNGCTVSFLEEYPDAVMYNADGEEIQPPSIMRIDDVYHIQTAHAEIVDFAPYLRVVEKQGWVELPYAVFPRYMCTFGYADGNSGYVLHAETGAIYRCEGATAHTYRLVFLAADLTQWFQPWLAGNWASPYTERMAKPITYGGMVSPEGTQKRRTAIETVRQALYREPRQFHGPHADLLARIYLRCLDLGGLIFHPATEAQVQSAEARLGQPLPSLLRDVYLQIGNGGFGPTYGLHGLDEGYPDGERTIIDSFLMGDGPDRGINVSDYEAEIEQTGKFVVMSGSLLPQAELLGCIRLSDDGCGMYSWLHLASLRVFQSSYWGTMQMHYVVKATSLARWFEQWLENDRGDDRSALNCMIDHFVMSGRTR